MPLFNSALLKIERAGSQADDLYAQARALYHPIESEEPAYRIDFKRDADPRKWRAVFTVLKELPDSWSILLGEIIYNLRSALDHLVYEASALDEDGKPLTGTEFPIFMDEGLFRKRAPYRMRGLNDATRALVEKYQPFAHGDPNIIHYLWLLQQLSNTDKHRLLNIVGVAHMLTDFSGIYQAEGMKSEHLVQRYEITKKQRLEDGAEFFAFWTREPLPEDTRMDMNFDVAVEIEFGDATPIAEGAPVFKVLKGMGQWVGTMRIGFIETNP